MNFSDNQTLMQVSAWVLGEFSTTDEISSRSKLRRVSATERICISLIVNRYLGTDSSR